MFKLPVLYLFSPPLVFYENCADEFDVEEGGILPDSRGLNVGDMRVMMVFSV